MAGPGAPVMRVEEHYALLRRRNLNVVELLRNTGLLEGWQIEAANRAVRSDRQRRLHAI